MITKFVPYGPDPSFIIQVVSTQPDGSAAGERRTMLLAASQPAGSPADNYASLLSKAQNALQNNQNFLGLAAPTNAQAIAQVQLLTRQVNALIYLMLHDLLGLSSIGGT